MKLIIGAPTTKTAMNSKYIILIVLLLSITSCKKSEETEKTEDVTIPVTLTTIDAAGLENFVELNGTATYLVKNIIKANATGYLSSVNVAVNDYVATGQILLSIKTREAKVLGNTINKIDPTLNFGEAIKVRSNTNGTITSINVQQGDYVQDGDALVTINDTKSFGIVLSLPYNLKRYVTLGKRLSVTLPDGTNRMATVQKYMPTVDATSQTQSVVLKIEGAQDLPENLIVKVKINKASSSNAVSLPKAAVLSDQTETHFWIMKMINNNTAVKVPIEKGIATDDRIEIISPALTPKDQILLTGNYGVNDTIKVKVLK